MTGFYLDVHGNTFYVPQKQKFIDHMSIYIFEVVCCSIVAVYSYPPL